MYTRKERPRWLEYEKAMSEWSPYPFHDQQLERGQIDIIILTGFLGKYFSSPRGICMEGLDFQ